MAARRDLKVNLKGMTGCGIAKKAMASAIGVMILRKLAIQSDKPC
jgi:hypothetical protein